MGDGHGKGAATARGAVGQRIGSQFAHQENGVICGWAGAERSTQPAIGGPGVMSAQIEHLIVAGERSGTTIQVVPYGANPHPGLAGPFIILGFAEPSESDVVYLETVGGNLYVDKSEETRLFAIAFDHLRAVALSPGDTRAMLRAAADALK